MHGVDYIAASFVRRPEDIDTIRMVLGEEGAHIKVVFFLCRKSLPGPEKINKYIYIYTRKKKNYKRGVLQGSLR